MAKKKNLGSRKFTKDATGMNVVVTFGNIALAITIENKENTNDPKTPDKVFLGLILVNFFHLNIFQRHIHQHLNI